MKLYKANHFNSSGWMCLGEFTAWSWKSYYPSTKCYYCYEVIGFKLLYSLSYYGYFSRYAVPLFYVSREWYGKMFLGNKGSLLTCKHLLHTLKYTFLLCMFLKGSYCPKRNARMGILYHVFLIFVKSF